MFATFEVALTINTDLQFIMVGDGPLFNKLISLVNRKHLNENVHFLGQLPKPELRGWMQSCEAGILLSHNKSSPISVKEYLACGKPVVANNVGDIADYIIDDHTGFIVNPDNPEQVAKAILACVDNSFAFHDNCVRMAEKYDERVINEKLFQLIRQFDHATT
jgi:glycosyltransferase involved in cell wall biosynthesis